jgi:hypothetical protein
LSLPSPETSPTATACAASWPAGLSIAVGLAIFAAYPVAAFYIIGYSLVGGVGFASASYHLISTAVARAFTEKRGLAIGIANAGSTAGQFITVPMLTVFLTWFS